MNIIAQCSAKMYANLNNLIENYESRKKFVRKCTDKSYGIFKRNVLYS